MIYYIGTFLRDKVCWNPVVAAPTVGARLHPADADGIFVSKLGCPQITFEVNDCGARVNHFQCLLGHWSFASAGSLS